jgi:hypothetical protein
MASVYGVITYTQLQSFSGANYTTIDSANTTAVIESWISLAERLVKGYLASKNAAFDTTDDSVISAVCMVAAQIADNNLIRQGHNDPKNPRVQRPSFSQDVKDVLANVKSIVADDFIMKVFQ